MTSTQTRLRARSLSAGDHDGRPRPAKAGGFDGPGAESNKRSALPRAASDMNMRAAANADGDDYVYEDPERAFRDIAREQVDRETLRALAQFFKSTGPPTASHPPSVENCFGVPGGAGGDNNNNKRWSIRSLRKGPSKGRLRPASLHLGDHTVLRTTSAGHTYMAISIPAAQAAREKRSQLSPRTRHTLSGPQDTTASSELQQLDGRTASDEEGDPETHKLMKDGDLGVVVSRAASWHDRNSFTLSIRISTAERGVRTFLSLVDEWLEDQNTDKTQETPHKQLKITGSHHSRNTTRQSVPHQRVIEEQDDDEDEEDDNPIIMEPSPSTMSEVPEVKTETPTTPAAADQEKSFLNLGPDRSSLPPATSHGVSASQMATKASLIQGLSDNAKSSPRSSKTQKKPANINVKSRLQIPETSVLPESPGFPKMLASMEFPSPPESIRSHSASNSVSSAGMSPPLRGHASTATLPTNLDQRVMQLSRPPLRHHKSDGITQASAVRKSTMSGLSGARGSGIGAADFPSGRASRPFHYDTPTAIERDESTKPSRKGRSRSRASLDSSGLEDGSSQRQSLVSTVDSSFQSTAISDNPRYSLRSDTSVASDATATTEAYGKDRLSLRDSVDSTTFGPESGLDHKRSETPASLRSVSSTGTSATATSLRERRMARRAKIREKVQRDLDASKTNQVAAARSATQMESVDSPVLGWFPQNAPGASRKTTAQGPSRLAQQQVPSPEDSAHPRPAFGPPSKLSSHDITQFIPETVEETASPVTPTAPKPNTLTFSPIISVSTEPEESTPSEPTLSPIMVVASIEARPQSSPLRPLSLLSGGSPPPHLPTRSNLRPDAKSSWQRPFPVRVSKNPLELTINTNTKGKRNSSPHIPTPPMSPETASSPNISRPLSALPSGSAPSSGTSSSRQTSKSDPQPSASTDKKTQWLTAHQRQTAQEWRLAALRERMRRERMDDKNPSLETSRLSGLSSSEEGEERAENGAEAESSRQRQKQKREQHHRSTLNALSANAIGNGNSRKSFNNDLRNSLIPEANEHGEIAGSEHDIEQRLLRTIVPLLENMNNTLQDMRRDSVGRELSMKFMDSALALTNLENFKEPVTAQSSAGLPGPRARPSSVMGPPSNVLANGARKHMARAQSMS